MQRRSIQMLRVRFKQTRGRCPLPAWEYRVSIRRQKRGVNGYVSPISTHNKLRPLFTRQERNTLLYYTYRCYKLKSGRNTPCPMPNRATLKRSSKSSIPPSRNLLEARALVFDVLSQTVEVVWTRQKIAGYGTGPKKLTEHFSWIAPTKSMWFWASCTAPNCPTPPVCWKARAN